MQISTADRIGVASIYSLFSYFYLFIVIIFLLFFCVILSNKFTLFNWENVWIAVRYKTGRFEYINFQRRDFPWDPDVASVGRLFIESDNSRGKRVSRSNFTEFALKKHVWENPRKSPDM